MYENSRQLFVVTIRLRLAYSVEASFLVMSKLAIGRQAAALSIVILLPVFKLLSNTKVHLCTCMCAVVVKK